MTVGQVIDSLWNYPLWLIVAAWATLWLLFAGAAGFLAGLLVSSVRGQPDDR
jgi:hypothetical protein